MQARINYVKVAPGAYKAMSSLEEYLDASGIEARLLHLIKMRASQINGCAYCIDMHSKDLRVLGETEQRIYGLDAWEETPYYTDRERAALAWTEAVTLVTNGHVSDQVYEEVRTHFTEKELADLTLAVAAINAWNPPGHRRTRRPRHLPTRQTPTTEVRINPRGRISLPRIYTDFTDLL